MLDVPSAPDEPAARRAANARLREVIEAKDAMLAVRDAQIAVLAGQVQALAARVAELERRLGKDSSTSSRPPSSDSPYQKKPRDRSLRQRSGASPASSPARSRPRCGRSLILTRRWCARRRGAGAAGRIWAAR